MTSRTSFLLRVVYSICLIAGTSTHLWTIVTHGLLWDYNGVPVISRAYWTSLTALDPTATLLLFAKPRAGLVMTAAIVLSDVAHNTWLMQRSSAPDWLNWMYVSHVLFLIFVLATIRHAWRGIDAQGSSRDGLRTA